MKVKLLSRVLLLATPWTAAYQALPSMGFPRKEYWSGVPLPSTTAKPLFFSLNIVFIYLSGCVRSWLCHMGSLLRLHAGSFLAGHRLSGCGAQAQ